MAIRGCAVIAVEGTQASGKTTLVHALVAHYRQRGVQVDCVAEPARSSPFIEDIVLRGVGAFDLACEVDLFAAQLSAQLRAARHQSLLIADKTIANVLAYARLVLDAPPGSNEDRALSALGEFSAAWAYTYDAVFFCPDQYAQAPNDNLRAKVLHLQDDVATRLRDTHATVGLPLVDVPPGLTVSDRVAFVAEHLAGRGLTPALDTVSAP